MKTEITWQLDKEKQTSFRRRWFVLIGIVIVLALIIGLGYWLLELSIHKTNEDRLEEYVEIVITEGMGVEAIAQELKSAQVIGNTFPFKYYVWSENLKTEFKPGKFEISLGLNIPQVVSVLTEDFSGEVQLQILEGWDNERVAEEVSNVFGTTSQGVKLPSDRRAQIKADFLAATRQNYDYDFLADKPEESGLEGYLFPDTYRFFRHIEMTEVVQKLLENFGRKLDTSYRESITARGWTISEVVTLASIVQKEAKINEMPKVAGVFISRLKIGQRLESDATVNYITKKNMLQPTFADTKIESPYNTYRIYGLPQGPICNPGLAAIAAVIDPEISSYRYFLNTPAGDTIFSETYQEHLENKKQYLDGN
jgi:UPF0755 protein